MERGRGWRRLFGGMEGVRGVGVGVGVVVREVPVGAGKKWFCGM